MASEKSEITAPEKSQAQFSQRNQVPTENEYDDDPELGYQHFSAAPPHTSAPSPPAEDAAPPAYSTAPELAIPTSHSPSLPTSPSPLRAPPSPLRKPIAIPSTHASPTAPFLRAYPPSLASHNLPKSSFLAVLDSLNHVLATSPPLQVLDAAGGLLQSVPILFPLRIVGAAVSGLANLGGLGVARSRGDRAVRQANRDVFGPRGLRLEIAKLDALAHVAGIPILDSKGKVDQLAAAALLRRGGADDALALDAPQRLLRALEPWIAPLERETLPWTSKSKLTRFNAALKKRQGEGSGKADDERGGAAEEQQRRLRLAAEERDRDLLGLDSEEERARSQLREGNEDLTARLLRTIAQDRRRAEERYEAEVGRIGEEYAGEDLDEGWVKKTLWLVIREVSDEDGAVK